MQLFFCEWKLLSVKDTTLQTNGKHCVYGSTVPQTFANNGEKEGRRLMHLKMETAKLEKVLTRATEVMEEKHLH